MDMPVVASLGHHGAQDLVAAAHPHFGLPDIFTLEGCNLLLEFLILPLPEVFLQKGYFAVDTCVGAYLGIVILPIAILLDHAIP